MLTDDGKVLEVNSVGEPVSEATSEELHTQPTKEAPKISLQEVLFYFKASFFHEINEKMKCKNFVQRKKRLSKSQEKISE